MKELKGKCKTCLGCNKLQEIRIQTELMIVNIILKPIMTILKDI